MVGILDNSWKMCAPYSYEIMKAATAKVTAKEDATLKVSLLYLFLAQELRSDHLLTFKVAASFDDVPSIEK